MLMTCAKVEIIAGDELPDQICSNCAQNTVKLYLFKIKCEESDKTLRKRLKEGPFIVIDKIEINEEDILDKLQSEIKLENGEASDVLMRTGNENNPLETIVYEDYDACTSPKYFINSTITNSTLVIIEESLEENDLVHRKKVAEIAHQIKMIEHKLDCEGHEVKEDKNTKNGEAKTLVISLEDCMSTLKNSVGQSLGDLKNFQQDAVKRISTKSTLLSEEKFIASRKNLYECNTCKIKFSRLSS